MKAWSTPFAAFIVVLCLIGLPIFVKLKSPRTITEVNRVDLVLIDGKLREKGASTPFSGIMVSLYPGGHNQSRSTVVNGHLHGLSEGFYTNGTLQVREHFACNVSNGLRTKWHINGAKMSEASVVAGKVEGVFRKWDEQGAMIEELQMRNGEPDGVSTAYYADGSLKTKAILEKGKVTRQQHWKIGEFRNPTMAATH